MDRTAADPRTWDDEAPAYDGPADHGLRDPVAREAWRDLLIGVLPSREARVAEMGCGTATLTELLVESGCEVDGIDFSAAMVALARAKVGDRARIVLGDAADPCDPPFAADSYDVVLCRHVLWALPDPVAALARWARLLKPKGVVVLVEGFWSNSAGLRSAETLEMAARAGLSGEVTMLTDPDLWGRPITDERYLVVCAPSGVEHGLGAGVGGARREPWPA